MSKRGRSFAIAGLLLVIALVVGAWHTMRRRDAGDPLIRANHAIEQRDFASARALLERILDQHPADAAALLARGRLAGAETQWVEALTYLRRVPDTTPQSAAARYFEGLVLFEL